MTRKNNSKRIILVLVACLIFASCNTTPSLEATTPLPLPSNLPNMASATPTVRATITVTITFSNVDVVMTPDSILASSTLVADGSLNSSDLCKQVPVPQITKNGDDFTILNGRFALCVLQEGIAAFDLDSGALVNSADHKADIQLGATQSTLDGTVYYFVKAVNSSQIDGIDTASLTYTYCENLLSTLTRPGIFIIERGAIACVLTTQGQIALIRAESMEMFGEESVEFSFAILRQQ